MAPCNSARPSPTHELEHHHDRNTHHSTRSRRLHRCCTCSGRDEALRHWRRLGDGTRRRHRRLPGPSVHRHHGPKRLRQEHADASFRRARHADLWQRLHRRHRSLRSRWSPFDAAPKRQDRVHLPGLQPGSDAERVGEHHPADDTRRPQARQALARQGRLDRWSRPSTRPSPERTVGRSAAAGRRRQGTCQQPGDHLR